MSEPNKRHRKKGRIVTSKLCVYCNKIKPLNAFYTNKDWASQSFRDAWCRDCATKNCVDHDTLRAYCWYNNRRWSEKLYEEAVKKARYTLANDPIYLDVNAPEEKRLESGLPILYLCQDMREFELYGTMRAVIAVCDTMNYLTERADFVQTLKLVNNYLDPDGVFIFDLKTPHFYRDVIGTRTMGAAEEDAAYIWENSFDEESGINEYRMTFFEKQENGSYDRFEETHIQRAWTQEEILEMADEAGMAFVKFVKAYTEEEADGSCDRIQVILREQGKNKIPGGMK